MFWGNPELEVLVTIWIAGDNSDDDYDKVYVKVNKGDFEKGFRKKLSKKEVFKAFEIEDGQSMLNKIYDKRLTSGKF